MVEVSFSGNAGGESELWRDQEGARRSAANERSVDIMRNGVYSPYTLHRLAVPVQHVFVGAARTAGDDLVAHEAPVHISELPVAARARGVGHAGESPHAQALRFSFGVGGYVQRPAHRHRLFDEFPAQHIGQALAQYIDAAGGHGTPLRHQLTVVPDGKAHPGPGERMAAHRLDAVSQFGGVGLEELRRAGVAKNSSRTSTVVPVLRAVGCSSPLRPSSSQPCPSSALSTRVRMDTSAMEQMAASASPLKPMVPTDSRSDRLAILLVALRLSAVGSSARWMPQPLSSTLMSRTPPACSRTVIYVAPASSALSTSSRTTEAGRSTTSPAAIWLMSSSGSSQVGRRIGRLREEVWNSVTEKL